MNGRASTSAPDGDVATRETSTTAAIEDLLDDLGSLTDSVQAPGAREEAQDVEQLLVEAHERGLIESRVRRLRPTDAAEAFVGSVIFASPLLVEDGVFEIADHLFGFTVSGVPVFLVANTAFVVFMTYALLEWTGRNRDEEQLLLGAVPVRVVMVLGVSFLVAAILMTVWGRVGDWRPPTEALARINVLWTVGSLGAALGDILPGGESSPDVRTAEDRRAAAADRPGAANSAPGQPLDRRLEADALDDSELVEELYEQFFDLESIVDSAEGQREVQRLREQAIGASLDRGFGTQIRKYTSRDLAEAFVGSIFFSIPFLVEDGVYDVAEYFLGFTVGYFPVFFLANAAFVLLMIWALVYWAGPRDVRITRPLFGRIPRRLVGIAVVSFVTAAVLMTMWGRVDGWQDPVVAVARVSVVWTVASFGAALGDILPGESSGADLTDDLAALGDLAGSVVDSDERRGR